MKIDLNTKCVYVIGWVGRTIFSWKFKKNSGKTISFIFPAMFKTTATYFHIWGRSSHTKNIQSWYVGFMPPLLVGIETIIIYFDNGLVLQGTLWAEAHGALAKSISSHGLKFLGPDGKHQGLQRPLCIQKNCEILPICQTHRNSLFAFSMSRCCDRFFPFFLPYVLPMLYWPTCVAWNVVVWVAWPDVVWMPVLSPTRPQWGTDPSRGRLMAQSCVDKAWSPSHHCHLTVIAAAAIKEIWSKHDKTCQKKQHNGWIYSKL